jgi:hypothetical protein
MRQPWKKRETRKVVWTGNLKERDGSKCIGVNGREILKWTLKEHDGKAWTLFI